MSRRRGEWSIGRSHCSCEAALIELHVARLCSPFYHYQRFCDLRLSGPRWCDGERDTVLVAQAKLREAIEVLITSLQEIDFGIMLGKHCVKAWNMQAICRKRLHWSCLVLDWSDKASGIYMSG